MIEGVNGTSRIRKVLPIILEALHITSFVDAPCGDFNWMQKVNLTGTSYLGIDVVPELVAQNQRLYHSKDINFMQGDLLSDKIPKCDLIMVRDLLIHHSNRSAIKILENIIQSDVFYLLVSNYSGVKRNLNTFSGGLRLYNLYEKPFSSVKLPHPLLRFTDGDGAYGREMVLLELK
ncbi:MAG: hypothetical protein KDD62_01135 [Bdellovibrionales bacterium]|nr:hypothetical protein [Bdellovibrionales bacterium]